MRKFTTILMILFSITAYGQETATDTKARQVKASILQAFGGKKALLKPVHFSYTISRTAYGIDTTFTRTHIALDLNSKFVTETRYTPTDTVIKEIGANGSWVTKSGIRKPLPTEDEQRLQQFFYTNFIPMLRNEALVYTYKMRTIYKGRQADVVQVYTPQKKALIMDLFVDAVNGRIITSSRPGEKTGTYNYYADELDYQPIGEGIIFPLTYQVWTQGKLTVTGRFEDVLIK